MDIGSLLPKYYINQINILCNYHHKLYKYTKIRSSIRTDFISKKKTKTYTRH